MEELAAYAKENDIALDHFGDVLTPTQVTKDTPQDVRDKIAAVAAKTVMCERAQAVAAETGALVYWMDAEA